MNNVLWNVEVVVNILSIFIILHYICCIVYLKSVQQVDRVTGVEVATESSPGSQSPTHQRTVQYLEVKYSVSSNGGQNS